MPSTPFVHRHRVRYHECDAQGVVFNANYLTFVDVAMTELFRTIYGSYAEMNRHGYDWMVVDAHIAWKAPARFDDDLAVALTVTRFGRTSMTTRFVHSVGERACAEGEIVHVWVDYEGHQPVPVPQAAIEALAAHTEPAP